MSVKRWAYSPEKCDGDYCPGSCYICSKADDSENVPIEAAMAMLVEAINAPEEDI